MNEAFTDKRSGYKFMMKIGNPTSDHILEHGIFEWPLIEWCKQFLKKDKVFVDIGAHMGTYSINLSSHCREVHAFEAQVDTYSNLCGGIKINDISNIVTHHTALGNKDDDGKMMTLTQVSPDGGGSTMMGNEGVDQDILSSIGQDAISTYKVKVTTLDSYNLNDIGFMKLDVEGWELNVIQGASETLARNNYPPFIFEVWPDKWYEEKKTKLISYIERLGYKCFPIQNVNNMYLATF